MHKNTYNGPAKVSTYNVVSLWRRTLKIYRQILYSLNNNLYLRGKGRLWLLLNYEISNYDLKNYLV